MQGVCRAKDIFEIKRNALLQKVIENDSSKEGLSTTVAECHKQE
jgi:predicted transcriptional regulator